jgi:CheY-like chemotaxis protein
MKKILILDDSTFQQKILSAILKEAGYDLVFAENGKTGLAAVEKEKPDLVITDLLMPEFDGIYFLEHVRLLPARPPVVIVTSDIQQATLRRCLGLGASGYLNKPVRRETLLPAVEKALAGERP